MRLFILFCLVLMKAENVSFFGALVISTTATTMSATFKICTTALPSLRINPVGLSSPVPIAFLAFEYGKDTVSETPTDEDGED
jgi:hypothetical protein